ncbi:MAG: hypothetical protein AAF975_08445 [Spirochaetota bacterium]
MFAKIFDSETCGQILVLRASGTDDNPEVRVYFQPKDMGVCSMGSQFESTDSGEDAADKFFSMIDLDKAQAMVLTACGELFPNEEVGA